MSYSPLYILSQDLVRAMEDADNAISTLLLQLSTLETSLRSGTGPALDTEQRRALIGATIAFRRLLDQAQHESAWLEVKARLNEALLDEYRRSEAAKAEFPRLPSPPIEDVSAFLSGE